MYCVDRIIVKQSDAVFSYLDDIAHKAKLLYNAALFRVRNHFTASEKTVLTANESAVEQEVSLLPVKPGRVISAFTLQKLMVLTHNPDYYAGIPSQTAQHVISSAVQDFKNWLKAMSHWKKYPASFLGKPHMPHYVKADVKDFVFTSQTASVGSVVIRFPKTDAVLHCRDKKGALREIKVTPYYGGYLVCICFETADVPDNAGMHTAAVDFGVDNTMAVVSDTGESVIFKGGAVKARNQLFNKRRAELVGIITNGHVIKKASSHLLDTLSMHRSEWIHDTFHKMSARLIEWCEAHDVGTIVLGINRGWKRKAGIGTKNNQSFVSVPFSTLQFMIRYKAGRSGISVAEQEESYTSKASFIDNDAIPVYGETDASVVFSGCRSQRGLYKSKGGILINADINGAANILRKYGVNTSSVSVKKLLSPMVLRQPDLNKRIPVKGIAAA